MEKLALSALVACAFSGCVVGDSGGELGASARGKTGDAGTPIAPAPEASSTIVLVARSILPGATSVATQPAFVFATTQQEPVPTKADFIARRMRLVDEAGSSIPIMSVAAEADVVHQFAYTFMPARSLVPDRWYRLEIITGSDLVVVSDQVDPPANSAGRWSAPFFTGSAPRVRHVEYVPGADQMLVVLSETMDLSAVVASDFVTDPGVSVAGKCFVENACSSTGPKVANAFTLRLSGALAIGADSILLRLTSAARGVDRTADEGAAAAGLAVANVNGTRMIETSLAPAAWVSCQRGAARCWTAGGPGPGAPGVVP